MKKRAPAAVLPAAPSASKAGRYDALWGRLETVNKSFLETAALAERTASEQTAVAKVGVLVSCGAQCSDVCMRLS